MKDSHVFIDTNILIYAHDKDAGEKHLVAKDKIKEAWSRVLPPALSVQVLQELYVNLVKKGVELDTAQKLVNIYSTWELIENDLILLQHAFDVQKRWKLSFWDSLIVAAAKKAKVSILWSEDFNSGQRFEGVTVVNPLA